MSSVGQLSVKIFADGADLAGMLELYRQPFIKGFTTNPTLMRKAGIRDYRTFAVDVLRAIPDRPISFEVFSDSFPEMERQAHEIASWGENVYVNIPVTNTERVSACDLIRRLSHAGVKINVTAVLSLQQVRAVAAAVAGGAPSCVSVFAGRIAVISGVTVLSLVAFREFARAASLSRDRWLTGIVYAGIAAVGLASLMSDRGGERPGCRWYKLFVALPAFVITSISIVPIVRDRVRGEIQKVALSIIGFIYIGWMFGHLGFLARGGPRFWADRVIIDWISKI